VQTNYIRVQFHLNKAVYNVSNAVSTCMNSSETCAMDLKFFSSEKLVMELPVRENSSLWNEEFVVVSECEPRTILYAMCVIAVPVLVILFAFS
jgi:peptidyl-prolyl cis-trans isomerase SDCCAG10